jgi:hypothetical protein
MIKNGIDMRTELSQQAKVTHRVSIAIDRVARDLEHTFILQSRKLMDYDLERFPKTAFRINFQGDQSELAFTTVSHLPLRANVHESDQTFVVYKLEKDKENPNRTNLMRGETKVLTDSLKEEDVPLEVLAKDIKSFLVIPWDGNTWKKDRWDAGRGDQRDKLPQLVKIEIEGWEADSTEKDPQNEPTISIRTSVIISRTYGMGELKERANEVRWNSL